MLELVVVADALFVVQAWEQAIEGGVAVTTVHSRDEPDTALSLTLLDARPWHGVWLGVLAELREQGGDGDPPVARGVPTRPRTAVLTKNHRAVIIAVDDRASRLLGWRAEQLMGERSTRFSTGRSS